MGVASKRPSPWVKDNITDLLKVLGNLIGEPIVRVAGPTNLLNTGQYVSQNGTLQNIGEVRDRITDFIPVTPNNYYLYQGYLQGSGRSFIAFYTAADETTFISSVKGDATYQTEKLIKAPANAAYIRCSYMNEPTKPFAIVKMPQKLMTENVTDIATLFTTTSGNSANITDLLNSTMLKKITTLTTFASPGKYVNGSGVEITESYSNLTDYIAINPNTYYVLKAKVLDGRAYALYDTNKVFLSATTGTSKGNPGVFVFYSGSKGAFLRASIEITGQGATPSVILYEAPFLSVIGDKVNTLEGSASDLLGGTMVKKVTEVTTFLTPDSYLDAFGTVVALAGSNITDYIAITPKTYYTLKAAVKDARAFALYDANKVFISAITGTSKGNPGQFAFYSDAASFIRVSIEGSASVALYTLPSLAALGQKVDDLQATTNYDTFSPTLIGDHTTLPLVPLKYINSSGGENNGFSGDKCTDFIAILPNTKYRYNGRFKDARCVAIYDANKVLIRSVTGTSVANVETYEFISESNAAFFRGSSENGQMSLTKLPLTIKDKVGDIQKRLDSVATGGTTDYEISVPPYVFAIENDAPAANNFYGREYTQFLYPESVVKAKLPIKINGQRAVPLKEATANTSVKQTYPKSFSLSGGGYLDKPVAVNLIKTRASNAKDKQIRYMAIGDSMTDNNHPGPDGTKTGGGNYQGIMKCISMLDNYDFGDNKINLLAVGTRSSTDTNVPYPYKGQSFTVRAFDEGRGSWTVASYLRHPYLVRSTDDPTYTQVFGAAIAWDSLGLGRKIPYTNAYDTNIAYETWTGSAAQKKLLATTPTGKYKWDYTQTLWDFFKRSDGAMGTYTGSQSDKDLIDTKMNSYLDSPLNPFYDKNIARATGDYAFSMATYLSRYKTLADDGVTRLVLGSTAGSKVTSGSLSTMDVCTPTHVTLELGENDRWHFAGALTVDDIVNDLKKMMDLITTEYPSIKVGFFTTRMQGPFYADQWNDVAQVPPMDVASNAQKFDMDKAFKTLYPDPSVLTNKWYIPVYAVHSVIGHQHMRNETDVNSGKTYLIAQPGDINHPGVQNYWSMAYQILAWIYYTL